MKRLYHRVYLGFLAVFVVFAVLAGVAAWIGRAVFDDELAERPAFRAGVGYLLSRAFPPPGADDTVVRGALQALAERFRMDVSLYTPSRELVAAVGAPVSLARRRGGGAPRSHPATRAPRRGFVFRLDDGRWLAARTRLAPTWKHWLPRWLPLWLPLWLGPLALLAIAIAIGAWPLARGLTRRIERLQARVDQLGAGSLSARIEVEGRDEVARLAGSFNRAAERIERLVEAQRHILAGASHELRTPLTRIRMAIELLDAEPERRAGIERDIAELDELIEELLTAARLDAPDSIESAEPVDLLALLAEEGSRVGAEVRGESIVVPAVDRLLRRLLRNLFENAWRHGGGSPISAEVVRRDGERPEAVLRVTNGGRPIPEHLRERIFEPFFRVEAALGGPSRPGRPAPERGVGLGLVLVRRIAEHHGGLARLVESGPAGTTFEVTLPLS